MSISIPSSKARPITRLAYPISVKQSQRINFDFLQRRQYADEAATQAEPEADGATEAQHAEDIEEGNAESDVESATEEATERASATAGSVESAAQTAGEAITGAAQSLGAAAGFGSQTSEADIDSPAINTSKTVYVGNLYFDVKREDLQKEFERAGTVLESKIIVDQRGLSKGLVVFFTARDAHTSYWQSLMLCLIETDSATSHLKPSKTPSAPSTSSTCKISKAVVSRFNSQSLTETVLLDARGDPNGIPAQ